jgi:hypothetical protein
MNEKVKKLNFSDDLLNKNLTILFNVLHFKYKHIFRTKEQHQKIMEERERKKKEKREQREQRENSSNNINKNSSNPNENTNPNEENSQEDPITNQTDTMNDSPTLGKNVQILK